MTGNERAEILCECFLMNLMLDALPPDVPHMREMKIQTKKLLRMFDRPNTWGAFGGDAIRILAGGSMKKFNKEQGQRDRQIGEQRRKLRQLSDVFFKALLRKVDPAKTNREYREWRRKLDAVTKGNVKKMMQEAVATLKPVVKLPA